MKLLRRLDEPVCLGVFYSVLGCLIMNFLGVPQLVSAQVLKSRWSGCFETVYVLDQGKPRKLERREVLETTRPRGAPGTGRYGEWVEAFCEPPGKTAYTYRSGDWPRPISHAEVQRLFQGWRPPSDRARVTTTWDFTGMGFSIVGEQGEVKK